MKKNILNKSKFDHIQNDLEEEHEMITQMLAARKKAGLTQEKIAEEMKTTPSAISRLESLESKMQHSPSISTLKKYARAVGCELHINFIADEPV